jgi:hypothetical protein
LPVTKSKSGGKLVSLFSHLFNKKKLDHNAENRQTEVKNDREEEGVNETSTSSFESEYRENTEDTIETREDENIQYEVVEREIHPAKIICPDCGGITLEGLEFCDKCGGELL